MGSAVFADSIRLETHMMLQSPTYSAILFSPTASEAPPRASKVTATWTTLPGGVVEGGEIVILAIKPSMWRILLDSAPWLVTCCLLAGVLTWLGTPVPGLSVAATAQVMLLIAFARIALAIVRWIPTWYVLTNRRIIGIRGVRTPRISASPLVDIRNTYLHSSPAEKLARLATITFVFSHSEKPSHIWQSVAKPDEVHAAIRRAIENAIDQHGLSG